MEQESYKFILFLLFSLISTFALQVAGSPLQTYIVHVRPSPQASTVLSTVGEREAWYKSFLPSNIIGAPHERRLIYTYHNVVSGFAARLTREELAEMEKKPGFLQAYPDSIVPVLTTHTPRFLGLQPQAPGFWNASNFGKGVIIGMLDTGVDPTLPSFSDNGLVPPPPAKWKGKCEFGSCLCNNKLLGGGNFVSGLNAMRPPRMRAGLQAPPYDVDGHGSHTASTAAGMFIPNVSIEGQALGTAAGIAPYAHLAIYKVCGPSGCANSDILAGMDTAAGDGVDIMSLSLGGFSQPYYSDSIAIGAFGATEKGIFVSCAAGNSGPFPGSLSNEAPWMLTVGASTIDRNIRTTVKLGNGAEFFGESIHQPKGGSLPGQLPLIHPGFLSWDTTCSDSSLGGVDVRGKVVVCDVGGGSRVDIGKNVMSAGGVGMIMTNTKNEGYTTFTDVHVLPASHVSYVDAQKIKAYIKSTADPTASISFDGTVTGKSVLAPTVAYFSSRGPSGADPNILKPDIIGPGVNILAAWPFAVGNPGVRFNIISGTSMATPHLTGVVALLKNRHPDWSPAMIKSSIMTTATTVTNDPNLLIPDESHVPADPLSTGAGHVSPAKASRPGLVYDIGVTEYIQYLCGGVGYTDDQVSTIARRAINCSEVKPITSAELNYPSFMVVLSYGRTVQVSRTVTNVGPATSTYDLEVRAPCGTTVTVSPTKLSFTPEKKKASYSVTFSLASGDDSAEGRLCLGGIYSKSYLRWVSSDKKFVVNSPIMVMGGSSAQAM